MDIPLRYLLACCATACAITPLLPRDSQAAVEAKYCQHPALSADGSTAYFSCWGDIWSVPADGSSHARRLTDNVAAEQMPVPSPDGKQIAFISNRFGNWDIFVMPADGGAATRISFGSGPDFLYSWKPDGSAVLAHAAYQDIWGLSVYEYPLAGGTPRRLTGPDHDSNYYASYIDAGHLVYARSFGYSDWARKRHMAYDTFDLFSVDLASGAQTQLTKTNANDAWPQPAPDGSIYFCSDRTGTYNIYRLRPGEREPAKLTEFNGDGPHWLRISGDGSTLIFEVMGSLYTLPAGGGTPRGLKVVIDGDSKHEMQLDADMPNNVSEYRLSPNGKYAALIVMGDVYVLKNPEAYVDPATGKPRKPDQDLSRAFSVVQTPQREMSLSWSHKSGKLAYVSDRDGQYEVYVLDLATNKEARVTSTEAEEYSPQFSPTDDKLVFYSGNRSLLLHDFKTAETTELVGDELLRIGPFDGSCNWSPDGKWVVFTGEGLSGDADIKVVNIDDRSIRNICLTPDWETGAEFSRDGKYIAYASSYYTRNWDFVGFSDIVLVELDPRQPVYDTSVLFPDDLPAAEPKADAPAPADATEAAAAPPAADAPPAPPTPDAPIPDAPTPVAEPAAPTAPTDPEQVIAPAAAEQPAAPPVKINFERIEERGRIITGMQGEVGGFIFDPSSSYILFSTDMDGTPVWMTVTIGDEGGALAPLPLSPFIGYPQFSPDGSKLVYLDNGLISFIAMAGPQPGGGGGMLPATSRVRADQYAIWRQVFAEGWRTLKHGFYDPNMNGADWDGVLRRYQPQIEGITTYEEFATIMREVLGELGGSHLGYYPPTSSNEAPADVSADLGVNFDESHAGAGYLVSEVIKGGPADLPGQRLYAGDTIVALDGQDIPAGDNRARRLLNLLGRPVVVRVASGAAALEALAAEQKQEAAAVEDAGKSPAPAAVDGMRSVTLLPAPDGALYSLRYEQWVRGNRAMVEQLAGGRIGYQHIEGMDPPSLAKFRRELFTHSIGKKALIIDVRFNGGGAIHEELIEMLDRRNYGSSSLRDGPTVQEPNLVWKGPIVVLTNAASYSDAEIFPHLVKELGLGTVMGEPTGGNVIGTSDFELMDGSSFRLPLNGWYMTDGTDMEGNGVQPDIFVAIDPQALRAGRDNQIERAVSYLQEKLGQ